LAITSPTSGGRLVGIVRSLTQTMEFFRMLLLFLSICIVYMGNGFFAVVSNVRAKLRNVGNVAHIRTVKVSNNVIDINNYQLSETLADHKPE
jgi:hypothetical protein